MKLKLFAGGMLVLICLIVLVVEGVSQPPASPFTSPPASPPVSIIAPSSPSLVSKPPKSSADFSTVQPQQEWTFEQLVEALKGVRARQKELKTQEADLLTKMAEKVEEKRKDLARAEEVLQQLQGDSGRLKPLPASSPVSRKEDTKSPQYWGSAGEKK
jgi:hypothetical protein